jgi:hypothetical protein
MKLLWAAVLGLSALIAVLAGGGAEADITGGISGRVSDQSDSPIEGAFVEALPVAGCCSFGNAVTSADGSYTITGLTAGSYRVWVFADGYVSEFYDDTLDPVQATFVAVTEGAITPGIDFALSSGGSISGLVTDGSGAPIEGALVDALLAEGCCSFGGAQTAADGTYTVNDLSGTSYLVFASATGFKSEYYDDTIDDSLATPVPVTPGATTSGIDFALSACSTAWSQPAGDDDCDGFSSTVESFVGTLPLTACAATPDPDDEPLDGWPTDNNDDQVTNLPDVLAYIPVFNSTAPGPPYGQRFDLNTDGQIGMADVLLFIRFFNQTCTP